MMERIERKIVSIVAEPRIWGDDKGNGRAAEVGFVLETQEGVREYGEYRSTESAWSKVIERSTPFVGQVFTFDADPKKPYKGTTQWGLKSYPGKPEGTYAGGGGSGGGGQKRGDWESSVERADRRLNDAAGKVLGVAAVMIGDGGTPVERAASLEAIVGQVADAFAQAREALKPDFPNLGTVEPVAPTAPVTAPPVGRDPAPDPAPAPESKTWGPAPKAGSSLWGSPSDADQPDPWGPGGPPAQPHPDGADDGSRPDDPVDPPAQSDLDTAWTQLSAHFGGSGSKALIALNKHFGRKSNRDAFTYAEVMEVVVALA